MRSLFTFSLLIATGISMAQAPSDPKHENHYRAIPPIETNEYKIEFIDQHSQQAFTKMKLVITNNTEDFLIVKPAEINFIYGDDKVFNPKSGMLQSDFLVIEPESKKSRVIEATGEGHNFHVENFKLSIKGLYKAPIDGEAQKADNFKLPLEANDFRAGAFKVENKSFKATTAVTNVAFKVNYKGKNIGLFNPYKLKIKLEDGQTFPNAQKNIKTKLLKPGKSGKFTAVFRIDRKIIDMQFANMEIVWNDMFVESKLVKLDDVNIDFTLDPGKTAGKNK